ncbi:MAG: NAD(P)-binding domain-containing protein [Hymenobacter sp.]
MFNIGMDQPELSVREFAEIFNREGKEIFGYTGTISFGQSQDKEYMTDNPNRRCPDLTKGPHRASRLPPPWTWKPASGATCNSLPPHQWTTRMITVLGLGFVGLTTALGFSKKGFKVYGIDVNEARMAKIRRYEVPFYEPHLEECAARRAGQNFLVDASLAEAVNDSKLIIICVGTPGNADGSANLTYLLDAVRQVFMCVQARATSKYS